jgi:hypothetical protein
MILEFLPRYCVRKDDFSVFRIIITVHKPTDAVVDNTDHKFNYVQNPNSEFGF